MLSGENGHVRCHVISVMNLQSASSILVENSAAGMKHEGGLQGNSPTWSRWGRAKGGFPSAGSIISRLRLYVNHVGVQQHPYAGQIYQHGTKTSGQHQCRINLTAGDDMAVPAPAHAGGIAAAGVCGAVVA